MIVNFEVCVTPTLRHSEFKESLLVAAARINRKAAYFGHLSAVYEDEQDVIKCEQYLNNQILQLSAKVRKYFFIAKQIG